MVKNKQKSKREMIQNVVELVYLSGFIKGEKPLSLFLLAPPEQSKTFFIFEKDTKFCHVSTDLSFQGILRLLTENSSIKHIIIPDFLKITGKKTATKNNLITMLNSYMEEGIYDINLGNERKINLDGRSGGIITATTDFSYHQNKKSWGGIGFISRFLTISYKLSDASKDAILDAINGEISSKKSKPKRLSYRMTAVKSSKEINKKIQDLNTLKSPRRQKQLILLAKSIALRNGRDQTNNSDVKELEKILPILNTDFNEI